MKEQPALLFATDFGAAARAARLTRGLLARTLSLPCASLTSGRRTLAIGDEPTQRARSSSETSARELSASGLTIAEPEVLSGSAAEALIHHADADGLHLDCDSAHASDRSVAPLDT